jgi:ATP-dependent Clp protease ATP-binding subunit ClpC
MQDIINIAPAFTTESVNVLIDALLSAQDHKNAEVSPAHILQTLWKDHKIKKLLEEIKVKSDFLPPLPEPTKNKSASKDKVGFDKEVKKSWYIAFSEMIASGREFITPYELLLANSSFFTKTVDQKLLKDAVDQALGTNLMGKKSQTPTLDKYTVDLTVKAQNNQIDPVIGREKEIQQTIRILTRRTKSNAILLGEAGVGKTAIAEGLALQIAEEKVPEILKNVHVLSLNMTSIVSGAMYQGQLEQRMENLVKDVKHRGNIILFIDEVHMIMGAGQAAGTMTAANILKPALARGEIHCIGATTPTEYRQHIEKDPALSRRFEPVQVNEPSDEVTHKILLSVAKKLTEHHSVTIPENVIKESIALSKRYIQDRYLPDKAIDILDEATSGARIAGEKEISVEDIKKVLAQRTGIPLTSMTEAEQVQLLNLESKLKEHIIGQDEAIKAIASVIKRSRAGLTNPNRPLGSFLFLGRTGTGKTETAKVLSRLVYNSEKAMIRMDMSEYMESHTADKLIGAPPGYVGYEEGGQLTNPVRRRPYSLILLDELEKAHPKVFDVFLQVLEDGRLTDSQGHTVNFKNTIIIMTSNIDIFQFDPNPTKKLSRAEINQRLTGFLRPEFVNRIDDIIVFNPLTLEAILKIASLQINEIQSRLKQQGYDITIPLSQVEPLLKKIDYRHFGARPLRRVLEDKIENPIAQDIISNKIKKGEKTTWTIKN